MIRTRRLEIRPYRLSDFPRWAQVRRERLPKQNAFDRGPLREDTITKAFFSGWLKKAKLAQVNDSAYFLGVFDRRTGANIGHLDFIPIVRLRYQVCNLGYYVNNQFWGKGYGAEAVKAALPAVIKTLKFHRIEAGIEPHNKASIKLARKAGLKLEGKRRKFLQINDRWADLVYYVATAEDFGIKMKATVSLQLKGFG